jgi:hypothetical protein
MIKTTNCKLLAKYETKTRRNKKNKNIIAT